MSFSGNCHDCDTQSTLYHSVRSWPHIYHPFHCMYLWFPIISILFVSPPIGECFVRSVFPYNYLMCFCLWFRLLTVLIPSYLLIWYTLGNWPWTSLSLLIALCELHSLMACPTPRAVPHTFYSSIQTYVLHLLSLQFEYQIRYFPHLISAQSPALLSSALVQSLQLLTE